MLFFNSFLNKNEQNRKLHTSCNQNCTNKKATITYYICKIKTKMFLSILLSQKPTCICSWHTPCTLACPLCTAPSHGPDRSSHDSQTPRDCLCPPVEDKRHRCCLLGTETPVLCQENTKTTFEHFMSDKKFLSIFLNDLNKSAAFAIKGNCEWTRQRSSCFLGNSNARFPIWRRD